MAYTDEKVKRLIKKSILDKNPKAEVILFGSHARGDAHKNSDWDVLILLNEEEVDRTLEQEYREVLFEVELEIEQAISTFVHSKQDWESKYNSTPLYQNVKSEGVIL